MLCREAAGGGGRGETPPRPQERLVSPPRNLYIFLSQNEDKFPFLERIEWQIPYSDIFSNHPGGFVSLDKVVAVSCVGLFEATVG